MGSKIAIGYVILCAFAALCQLISLGVRWHMAGGTLIFRMDTTLFSSQLSGGGVGFLCNTALKNWSECRHLSEGMWLQDLQAQTCAPLIKAFASTPCEAYKAAYVIGMVSLMAFVLNWLLMGASGLVLRQYMTGKHKPEYRSWSLYLLLAGMILLLLALMLWSFIALPALDRLGSFVSAMNPAGASYGYLMMWFSIIFQGAAAILHWWMPLSNEMTEEDRLQHEMQKEYQQYGAAQASQAFAPGYYASPQAGFGAPYGAPGYAAYGGQGAPNAPGYGPPGAPGYGAPPPGAGGQPGMPPQWGQQA